jgi:hypothetical protein
VYDSRRLQKQVAKTFIEQKMVVLTEIIRQDDSSWRLGGHQACQNVFGPILQQRIDEMGYLDVSPLGDGDLEISDEIIRKNIVLLQNSENHKKQNVQVAEMSAEVDLLRSWQQPGTLSSPSLDTTSDDDTEEEEKGEEDSDALIKASSFYDGDDAVDAAVKALDESVTSATSAGSDVSTHSTNRGTGNHLENHAGDLLLGVLELPSHMRNDLYEIEDILRIVDEISRRNVRETIASTAQSKERYHTDRKTFQIDKVSVLTTEAKEPNDRSCFLCSNLLKRKQNLVQ